MTDHTYHYDLDTGLVTYMSPGAEITFSLEEMLKAIPDERAKYAYLLEHLYRVRREKIDNLGDFMQKIIDLTVKEAEFRDELKELLDVEIGDVKKFNARVSVYKELIKACLTEKNTLTEYRHAQKFLTFEEGKLLAEIEDLEV